jgi:hypothetical protein
MNDFENFAYEGVDFKRFCFSIETLLIKETMSRKGQMVRELLQLPYCYKYDNQIQFVVTYDNFLDRDELGFSVDI